MAILVPRSKAAIVVETRAEKIERKVLAQERRQERLIEQQKMAQHMENLMEKVFFMNVLMKEFDLFKIRFFGKHRYRKKMKIIYVIKLKLS